MTPEIFIAVATGQGSALIVLLLWIRSVIKDRDFYRELHFEGRKGLQVAVEELEHRPRPNGPNPGLRVVGGSE